jgi:hypothetical protein
MAAKIILGLIFLLIGLWLLLPLPTGLPYQGVGWEEFMIVLIGIVPAFLVFLGVLIMWIEFEDMKASRAAKK